MQGSRIRKAKSALTLFIRSLPLNCKYSIISFGSSQEIMKTIDGRNVFICNEEQNSNAINKIEHPTFDADFGGTDILTPLTMSFDVNDAEYGNLKKRVFILTDGMVNNREDVIEAARNGYNSGAGIVHTFGIGSGCD